MTVICADVCGCVFEYILFIFDLMLVDYMTERKGCQYILTAQIADSCFENNSLHLYSYLIPFEFKIELKLKSGCNRD